MIRTERIKTQLTLLILDRNVTADWDELWEKIVVIGKQKQRNLDKRTKMKLLIYLLPLMTTYNIGEFIRVSLIVYAAIKLSQKKSQIDYHEFQEISILSIKVIYL